MKKFTLQETAKLKAEEILKEIFNEQHNDTNAKMIIPSSIAIAKILVDKIIVENCDSYHQFQEVYFIEKQKYWEAVKNEIEKF